MVKIILWGTGKYGEIAIGGLDFNICEIVAVVDSDTKKQKHKWHDHLVVSFEEVISLEFDYFLIAVKNNEEIVRLCRDKGFEEKVVIFGQEEYDWINPNTLRNSIEKGRLLGEISKQKYELELKELELKNYDYEHGFNKIKIINAKELLSKIIDEKLSLVRFGDGEIELIRNQSRPWFQKVDEKLSLRLKEVLDTQEEGIIVAVADDFGSLEKYNDEAKYHIRHYVNNNRAGVLEVLDTKRTYYDAYVSRPYLMYTDKNYSKEMFDLWKKIWFGRNVLIVEGPYIRNGVGNDLFVNTNSIKRVIGPSQNAFDRYTEIIKAVKNNAQKDDLILISLGPTATVLAYDLFMEGYQAIDLGQLDNEYEWYKMGATTRVPIPGKAVPENPNCYTTDECIDEKYLSEIVADLSK